MNITKDIFEETLKIRNYWCRRLYRLDVTLGNHVNIPKDKVFVYDDANQELMMEIYNDLRLDISFAIYMYRVICGLNSKLIKRS